MQIRPVLRSTLMLAFAMVCRAEVHAAPQGSIPPLYGDEWWTDSDYGYAYGYDFYDAYGDYGYVAPGSPVWDAEWYPARSYDYENWDDLSGWFHAGSYLSYNQVAVIAARVEAASGKRKTGLEFGQQVSVRGRITELGADVVGKLQKDHLLVGLRTNRGETFYADLGPATALLQQLGVGEGREVTVSGVVEREAEPPLIRADSIEINGRTIVIRGPRRIVLVGRVSDQEELDVAGTDETHLAILLDTGRGTLAVNLGPINAERDLSLKKGQKLTVEGRLTKVKDDAFFTANHFRLGS